jgi:aminopeptidase N
VERRVADPRAGARNHKIDQVRMVVDVGFNPDQQRVRGTVTHYFRPLRSTIDSFYLDGPDITYKEVRLNGNLTNHDVTDGGIRIHPDAPRPWKQTDTLRIRYEATPRHGLYFTGWDDSTGRAPRQVWTQGQGPGHRHWVPFYDNPNDKLITETIITFDEEYRVLSNGERVGVEANGDGTKTWHYRMSNPHPGYAMMIGIGRYQVQRETSNSGVEIQNYYYPDQAGRAGPTYRHTAEMIDVMEQETGVAYPWSRYSQIPVHNFLHGGMENTTATVFSDEYYVDERAYRDRNYVTVNAHEIAHQWFGNFITMGRLEEIWLHESFATHYAKVIERKLFGEDHYQWNRKQERDQVLASLDRGPLPIRHTRAGSGRVYYKGSLVLDMLKDVVGKPEFDRVVERYLREHARGNVTSRDFFHAFDEVLGQNLDWFFDQWILQDGLPHYDISTRMSDSSGTTVTEVTVRQIHETGPLTQDFRMPIVIEAHYEDGSSSCVREWIDGKKTAVRLAAREEKQVDYVLFDPGNRVLKRQTFQRDVQELGAQLQKASNMIDRHDAAEALRETSLSTKRGLLTNAFATEPSPHVRAEIVRQLAEDTRSTDLLETALQDSSSVVRGIALSRIPTIADPLVDDFERALSDSSYQNVETALDRLTTARPSRTREYLDRTASIDGQDYNVRLKWLAIRADLEDEPVPDELIDYAGPSYSFRTRVPALRALDKLDVTNETAAAHLLDAAAHFSRDLRGPASTILTSWLEEGERTLLESTYRSGEWTSRQAARIERHLEQ